MSNLDELSSNYLASLVLLKPSSTRFETSRGDVIVGIVELSLRADASCRLVGCNLMKLPHIACFLIVSFAAKASHHTFMVTGQFHTSQRQKTAINKDNWDKHIDVVPTHNHCST